MTITVGRFLYPEGFVHERVLVDVQLIGSPPAPLAMLVEQFSPWMEERLIRLLQAALPRPKSLLIRSSSVQLLRRVPPFP
jgi:hypothetical protein